MDTRQAESRAAYSKQVSKVEKTNLRHFSKAEFYKYIILKYF